MLRRIKKIFFRLLLFGMILLVLVSILVNLSFVQTFLANKVSNYFAKNYDVEVSIKELDLDFLTKLELDGVLIKDHNKDTLLYVPKFRVGVRNLALKKNKFQFTKVHIENAYLNILQLPNEDQSNLSLFLSKFKGDSLVGVPNYFVSLDEFILDNALIRQRDDSKDELHLIDNFSVLLEDVILRPEQEHFDLMNFSVCYDDEFCINDFSMEYRGDSLNMNLNRLNVLVDKSVFRSDVRIKFPKDHKYDFEHLTTEYNLDIKEAIVFANELQDLPIGKWLKEDILFKGNIHGNLKKLFLDEMDIKFGDKSYLEGEGRIANVLSEDRRNFRFTFNELLISRDPLEFYMSELDFNKDLKQKLISGAPLRFNGQYKGDFRFNEVSGTLKTEFGTLKTDFEFLFTDDFSDANYQGDLVLSNVDIGKMLDLKSFGKTSLKATLIGEGLNRNSLDLKLNADIDYIGVNGYNYKDAYITGSFFKNSFVGEMKVADTSLNFDFTGKVDLTGEMPIMDFEADIKYADLSMLNIVSDSIAIFSTQMVMNFEGDNLDNLSGTLNSYRTNYETLDNYYYFNTISLESQLLESGERRMDVVSDMVQGNMEGHFKIVEVWDAFKKTVSPYVQIEDSIRIHNGQKLKLEANFKNTQALSELFFPEFQLATGSHLKAEMDEDSNKLVLEFSSPSIGYGDNVFQQVKILANTKEEVLKFDLSIAEYQMYENFPVRELTADIDLFSDSLNFKSNWKVGTKTKFDGAVAAKAKLNIPNKEYDLTLLPSQFYLMDSLWGFNENNLIHFDSNSCTISNLDITTGHQYINIDGDISSDSTDVLNINLKHFELENVKPSLQELNSAFSGNINGNVAIYRFLDDPYFIMDLVIDTLAFNDMWMGDLYFNSKWNSGNEDLSLDGVLMRGTIRSLDATGHYFPRLTENKIVADIKMDRLKFDYLEPYLNTFMSDLKGRMTGELQFDDRGLQGHVDLEKVRFSIPYLGTRYSIQGTPTVGMHTDKMHFSKLQVNVDRMKGKPNQSGTGTAVIRGDIFHDTFTDFIYDLDIDLDDFLCLATNSDDNSLYYGDGYASGHVSITGEGGAPRIVIDASTEKGSNIVIPLSDEYEIEESSFLQFRSPKEEGSEEETFVLDEELISKKFYLDLNLKVDPSTKVTMFIDQSTLTGTGVGDFRIMMKSLDDFSINGRYTVEKADYLFGVQYNLLDQKNFEITEGGTLTWDGDPYEGTMNIEAVYEQKVELSSLEPESIGIESTTTNEAIVYCKIKMDGKIMRPNVNYSIDIPKASDQAKIRLRELTNSEEKMTLQFASFLATNNFYVTERNINYVENTALSTGAGLITRQLNNLLNRAQDEFEVAVKFNPGTGTELSPQQIEFLLSKNLLNDRLRINGNFGTPIGANTSGMTGDVDVEYDLRKDRRLKLKVFNRSGTDIDEGSATNINTQGIGLFYRIQFNSIFSPKKKDKESGGNKSEKEQLKNEPEPAVKPKK